MTQQYPTYSGPLGINFHQGVATFRIWAPTAKQVVLVLGEVEKSMSKTPQGVWETPEVADVEGQEYVYRIEHENGEIVTTVDPYARAVTANGEKGVVVDVEKLLGEARRMPSFGDATEAIIYEAHVRDLTIRPDNGIKHKGKFLGLTEPGTRTAKGNLSGLDYLTHQGFTHLQLLPVYDFGSVDETGDLSYNAQYNWGYDPVHYNVPEGSYATNPHDPLCRLIEFKQLVDTLHDNGIRVIMDVVYNHVYETDTNPLQKTVPGYYFRMTETGKFHNATGCGNETASEQPMMRKFIVDSVVYWAKTFGLDGFRFDLMGIHDVDTMNAVRKALDEIDPGIIVIGEGWDLGNHPQGVKSAHQGHAQHMPRIGMFNDTYRDLVKGNNFEIQDRGFVSGLEGDTARRLFDALHPLDPSSSVVYNEAHDNWTMFDKLRGTAGLEHESENGLARRQALGTATQYLAKGILFLHAGQEFMRTKNGDENSYKSPDEINAFDYDRAARFAKESGMVRHLNKFRKEHEWTHSGVYVPEIWAAEGHHLSYRVYDAFGEKRDAIVMVNAGEHYWVHGLPSGVYKVHINDGTVFQNPQPITLKSEFGVGPLSVSVLERVE